MRASVRIGGMDKEELRQALRAADIQLNAAAEELFEDPRFLTSSRRQVLEIVALSVGELGFGLGATYGALIARALESGLVECPLELGPQLRLQFLDQAEGSFGMPITQGRAPHGSITIASPPLDDREETAKGFYLRCVDGVLWLRGYRAGTDHVWSPDDVLLFTRRAGD